MLIGLSCWLFLHVNNQWLQTTEYTIKNKKIPQSFHNMKIVHISDLHDARFGKDQTKLIVAVKKVNPQLIFFTGDAIDSNRYDLDNTLTVMEKLADIAPVYYVTGNHEYAVNQVDEIKKSFTDVGVQVLENDIETVTINNESIALAGIEDPLSKPEMSAKDVTRLYVDEINEQSQEELYTILLAHRPEMFSEYVDGEMDLTVVGHAHGGQIRLFGLGGLIAPSQGFFPEFTSGVHEENHTQMLVNRGLGNSIFPFRIFNRPEIVIIQLKSESVK